MPGLLRIEVGNWVVVVLVTVTVETGCETNWVVVAWPPETTWPPEPAKLEAEPWIDPPELKLFIIVGPKFELEVVVVVEREKPKIHCPSGVRPKLAGQLRHCPLFWLILRQFGLAALHTPFKR